MSGGRHSGLSASCLLLVLWVAGGAAAQQGNEPDAGAPDAGELGAGRVMPPGHGMGRAMPPGHGTGGGMPPAHGTGGGMPPAHAFLQQPIATAEPARDLEAGQVRVQLLDGEGRPAARAPVVLVTLGGEGDLIESPAVTDETGTHVYSGLATGTDQSYLARVTHQGALYRSPPFYLPPDTGYQVVVHRPDTTRDPSGLLLFAGQASLELLEGKLSVMVTIRLVNTSNKTYLFPEKGLALALPAGFSDFESSAGMEDWRIAELPGKGLSVTGSVPPGASTLSWQFELPVEGSRTELTLPLPWPVMSFRVVALAAPDMRLKVSDMPAAQKHEHEGRTFLVTELQRRAQDPALQELTISILGNPGPGSLRWVALLLSLLALAAGVLAAVRGAAARGGDPR